MRKPLYFSKRESCRQCCSDLLMANTLIVCVQVSSVSGSVLETIFKQWDSQGNLQCSSQIQSSRPVYIVQTTGGDAAAHNAFYVLHFIALQLSLSFSLFLRTLPLSICLLPVWLQMQASLASSAASQRNLSDCFLTPLNSILRAQLVCHNKTIFSHHEYTNECMSNFTQVIAAIMRALHCGFSGKHYVSIRNISHGDTEMERGDKADINGKGRRPSISGVLNPTACLHLGDVILFTVSPRHYPQYDM